MSDGRGARLSARTRELAAAKLGSSGLDWDDARALGIYALDDATSLHPSFEARPCLVFPYFAPGNVELRSPGCGERHVRVRYLGPPLPGFQAQGKERRYAQPPGTSVAAYLPVTVDWAHVAGDPTFAVMVTEGELKAASAAKAGISCLALGGVWSWRSAERCLPFLPELEAFDWRRRQVYLAFDSDLRTNAKVAEALAAFAEALAERGADPCLIAVPDLPGLDKTGLDDLVVAEGPKALWDLLPAAEPLTLSRPLWELNREVCYVRDPGLVVVRGTRQRMAPAAFSSHAYVNRAHYVRVVDDEGAVKLKAEKAAKAWLAWPVRAEAARLTYAPGEPEETDEGEFNLWPGWGCEPTPEGKKIDVRPWKTLLDRLFRDAEPEARRWFEQWCAYPIQNPGAKMFSAVVIWSHIQGVGKSLAAYSLGEIYGQNFSEIRQADLDSSFTEWAENKQLVLGEEVTATNKKMHAELLRKLVTQRKMRINVKMIPSYEVPDRINWFFTSNSPDALFMEDGDRRYFVLEVQGSRDDVLPVKFYSDYARWLREGGGASDLFRYLLDLDLSGFEPAAPAYVTEAKKRMIEDGRSDLGSWVAALLRDPASVLRVGEVPAEGDLFSARQLLVFYNLDRGGETRGVTPGGVARELRRQGAAVAARGEKLRAPDGREELFFSVRGTGWEKAPAAKCQRHLDEKSGR